MRSALFLCTILMCHVLPAQEQKTPERPRLVVGIVVDQMRQEYLYRFHDKYGPGGFKRLINDGFMLKNAHYNYVPTVTGPGHASVYTGTTPAIHGIIGNEYYDKVGKQYVNCVEDTAYRAVGSPAANGNLSPSRMISSTVTDELELFTQKKSKVIGVSIKDRGAILPAGHMPDAAYWYDSQSGRFMTSTYYMTTLPEWLVKFNAQNLVDKYLSQTWEPLLPLRQYTESGADDTPYERVFAGKNGSTFPYNLGQLRAKNGNFGLLTSTPFSNDYLTQMAEAALTGESMGKDDITDFLCISYSAPDAIGHGHGPNAVEVEDTYLRLDKNIESLLKKLDEVVGQGNYTLFLTADHAVADVPQYLKDNKMPAGYFNAATLQKKLDEYLAAYYPGKTFVENISNQQIFLNQEAFSRDPRSSGMDVYIVTELIGKYLMALDGISNYYTEATIRQGSFGEEGLKGKVIRGYHPKRSGDIVYVLESGWIESTATRGTTHGSGYSYDTHIPAIFFGNGIKKGSSVLPHTITDIAPTISVLLRIQFPSGTTGDPVSEALK
jgi:predicted AlkP superfamily pyrophosphatase or phosphodiesterase